MPRFITLSKVIITFLKRVIVTSFAYCIKEATKIVKYGVIRKNTRVCIN